MKTTMLSLATAALLGLAACNSEGTGTAENDNKATGTKNGTATTNTSSNDYAAMADRFESGNNEEAYVNPSNGKPARISVDRNSGRLSWSDNNEPVDYYVDKRTWWVYDAEGNQMGKARMDNDRLLFDDGDGDDNWVTYNSKLWKSDENGVKREVEKDGDTKTKYGEDMKVKTEADGDVKIRMGDKKIKKDEDGVKVKEKDNR